MQHTTSTPFSENPVLQAMEARRSIRKFLPDMPPNETIEAIIRAGLYAASGMNRQDTIILNITNRAMRDRLSAMNCRIGGWKSDFDPFYGAPAVLVVLADRTKPTCLYDGSLTMANLMLAAQATGVGSCWIHRAKEEFDSPEGKAILKSLGIEGDYEGIGHCVLGYPEGAVPATPPRRENRVFTVDREV